MLTVICYTFWGLLFLICGFLGLMEPTSQVQSVAMTILAVLFFVPPGVLVVYAHRKKDDKTLKLVRSLSILSLSLTLVMWIVNFASLGASDEVGNVLDCVLRLVSVPMVCSRHYVLSLFLWACLLFSGIPSFFRKKK